MIVVHHLNNSRSQRVLWLLEELGLPYEIKRYEREKSGLAPKSLEAVHPLGKSPVITDQGATLAESGAILEYLVDTYGKGRMAPAAGTPERIQYRYWMHYAEGSLMPPLLMKLIFDRVESSPMPFFVKPIAKGIAGKVKGAFISPNIKRHLDFMEASLKDHAWFAGDEFSAADIQMSFPRRGRRRARGPRQEPPAADGFSRAHPRPTRLPACPRTRRPLRHHELNHSSRSER
jgi:glutathione S-transferase